MQRVYKENEWGKVSKRIITLIGCLPSSSSALSDGVSSPELSISLFSSLLLESKSIYIGPTCMLSSLLPFVSSKMQDAFLGTAF